jgi:hypothetical protein
MNIPGPQTFPSRDLFLRNGGRGLRQGARPDRDKTFIEMNEARRRASGWVQRRPPKVVAKIDEPGHPTGHLKIANEENIMLKTISAALLAISVLAAPAMAGATDPVKAPAVKTTQIKTSQVKISPVKTTVAKNTMVKRSHIKASVLNANARMGHHHARHYRHYRHHHYRHYRHFRHHRFHKR